MHDCADYTILGKFLHTGALGGGSDRVVMNPAAQAYLPNAAFAAANLAMGIL
jgi:hypothetical protein